MKFDDVEVKSSGQRDNRPPRFQRVKAPVKDELGDLVQLYMPAAPLPWSGLTNGQ
jgi:hypothetical protein